MKQKTLRKKIRRLEKRLRDGPKKLAKLKRRLEAVEAVKAQEARTELAARAARHTSKDLRPIHRQPPADIPGATKPAAVRRAKRNLTPERREQLAAAMKARWVAKRAAVQTNKTNALADHASTMEQTREALEGGNDPAVSQEEGMDEGDR